MTGGRGLDSGGFLTRRRSGKERRPLLGEHHLAVDAVSAGKGGFKGGAWRHCGRLQESVGREMGVSLHMQETIASHSSVHPLSNASENMFSTLLITSDVHCTSHHRSEYNRACTSYSSCAARSRPLASKHTHSTTSQNYLRILSMYSLFS